MKALKPGDFTRTDVETNKQFTLTETSSLLTYLQGRKFSGSFYTGSSSKFNDVYEGPFYGSVKSQFYLEDYKPQTTQSLGDFIGVIQVSQNAFDEKIKEGSVSLVSSSVTFLDDSQGNLYLSGSESTKIGNVFYEFGTIVITDTGSYQNVGSGSFELTFRATHIKTELNFSATVLPNEFNYSTNKSARINGKTTLVRPRFEYDISEVSSSYGETITSQSIIPEFFGIYPRDRVKKTYITNYVLRSTPNVSSSDWVENDGTGSMQETLNAAAPPLSGSWSTSASAYIYSGSQKNLLQANLGRVWKDNEPFAVSLYVKSDQTGSELSIDVSEDESQNITVGTDWTRIQYTSSGKNPARGDYSDADIQLITENATFYLWGFQVEYGSTVHDFVETTGSMATTISSSNVVRNIGPDAPRLTPYATTVGFYNDIGDLLAVGKLASPTPIPDDFPITFKSRIDI